MSNGFPISLLAVAAPIAITRLAAMAASLGLWFWTQALLSRRNPSADVPQAAVPICDGVHRLTARTNRRLHEHPRAANGLLIGSSLVIDLLGIYILGTSILGPTISPFLGLQLIFALRQLCQAFCPLPPPEGMIWRNPGFPALLVTYGTSCDLFFSGHTAIAVFGAVTLADALGPIGIVLGSLIVFLEIGTVLVLRAHYTMDVFAGAVAALYVHRIVVDLAPHGSGKVWKLILLKRSCPLAYGSPD